MREVGRCVLGRLDFREEGEPLGDAIDFTHTTASVFSPIQHLL